jgi:hypothetical protein
MLKFNCLSPISPESNRNKPQTAKKPTEITETTVSKASPGTEQTGKTLKWIQSRLQPRKTAGCRRPGAGKRWANHVADPLAHARWLFGIATPQRHGNVGVRIAFFDQVKWFSFTGVGGCVRVRQVGGGGEIDWPQKKFRRTVPKIASCELESSSYQ